MALGTRARVRGTTAATALLPPGTRVRGYAIGRGHFRMSTGAIIAGVLFAAAFIVGLLLGRILIPGLLLVVYVVYEVRPPRAVVVTDESLAICNRSFWNGRPSKLLFVLPLAPLYSSSPSGSVTLDLGPERITLQRREFDVAAAAAAAPPPLGG